MQGLEVGMFCRPWKALRRRIEPVALACGLACWSALAQVPPVAPPDPPAPATAAGTDAALAALIEQLGADDYRLREQATRDLLALGPAVSPMLERARVAAADPEVRFRLGYILDNIVPPQRAVTVVRAAADSGVHSGDLITHVGGQRVRNVSELRQLLANQRRGARLSVHGADGPREVGPVSLAELQEMSNFVAPRGATLVRVLRLYEAGLAEQAYRLLGEIAEPIPREEWSPLLHARIAYTAGDAPAALRLLAGQAEAARPIGDDWFGGSLLELSGPGRAPYALELALLSGETGGAAEPPYQTSGDPDLRIQRVLVPAGRYVDALRQSALLWFTRLRGSLGQGDDATRVAGNQLAVCGWMLYELGLRSECCRLIEPRSKILRSSRQGIRKWVRVDTDAWLPLLAGDAQGALDSFYDDALEILQHPPEPRDADSLIRSPGVAAQLALFLYHVDDARRQEEALAAVNVHEHVALGAYAHWMLMALRRENEATIRKHLQAILPNVSAGQALPVAVAVALLEYIAPRPHDDVLLAARQRIAEASGGGRGEVWLAIIDALRSLCAGRPEGARAVLEPYRGRSEAGVLWETVRFLSDPPAGARAHELLASPLLAAPLGAEGRWWVALARDRRVLWFDSQTGELRALAGLDADWLPNPLCWPWIGRDVAAGRVWVYDRRRVIELTPQRPSPLRLNIRPAQIAAFDAYVAPHFDALAELLAGRAAPPGEDGEFLHDEVRAHADLVADPQLAELSVLDVLAQDPRVVYVGLRGGPRLLIDTSTGAMLSSAWVRQAAGLEREPRFIPQALWPGPSAAPRVMLCSDQGLIRVDFAGPTAERLALPGDEPYPPLVPEIMPYERRDPAWFYCARLPDAGGRVFRLELAGGTIEPLEITNVALPPAYYALMTRGELRDQIDSTFAASGLPPLEQFIAQVQETVSAWEQRTGGRP